MQEENDDFSIGMRGPLTPGTVEEAMEVRVIYFKLKFDYWINGGYVMSNLFEWIVG